MPDEENAVLGDENLAAAISFSGDKFKDYLAEQRLITPLQKLNLEHHMSTKDYPDYVSLILSISLMNEDALSKAIASFIGGEYATDIYGLSLSTEMLNIDLSQAVKNMILPVEDKDKVLTFLMTNPFHAQTLALLNKWVQETKRDMYITICTDSLFQDFLEMHSGFIQSTISGIETVKSHDEIRIMLEKAILDAITARASDIRIFNNGDKGTVTFRVDGDLVEYNSFDLNTMARLSAEVANEEHTLVNDTNENVPRTGIMNIAINEKPYELRVNFIPTRNGIDTNLRFLYQDNFDIEKLGASKRRLDIIKSFADLDTGLILFTGATGSGKSTTLYSVLELIRGKYTICTVEDPVEHRMDGIVQVNVSPLVPFEAGIQSFLRHDPDVIVVGEIRSPAVAENAIVATDTGHLVFSTLHTKTALSAIARLRGLGITNIEICDNLVAVVAQQLLKRVCPKCAGSKSYTSSEMFGVLGLQPAPGLALHSSYEVATEVGCNYCNGRGTYDRCLGTEILLVNDEVRHMISSNASVFDIRAKIVNSNLLTLEEEVISHVINKVISIEEAARVLGRVVKV